MPSYRHLSIDPKEIANMYPRGDIPTTDALRSSSSCSHTQVPLSLWGFYPTLKLQDSRAAASILGSHPEKECRLVTHIYVEARQNNVSTLHQYEGGIGKSIPWAQKISGDLGGSRERAEGMDFAIPPEF